MALQKLTPTQFATWFQIVATIIMTLGLVILTQMNNSISNLSTEIVKDRAILNSHLIDHPSHAIDARLKVVEALVAKSAGN